MSSSLLSYSPISIKLGLYHSILSTISVSVPVLLCLYISMRYERKYIVRSYLALTIGQTLSSLFFYYGPYALTSLWSYFSPMIAFLGALFTFQFIVYLKGHKKSVTYPPFFYLYFFGIMFLNPIRFGTFTPFFLSLDLLPLLSIFYFLSSSLVFFCINTITGLLMNEFSKAIGFYYMPSPVIQDLACYLLATTSVLFWVRLPIALIYWFPLRMINTPENLPEFIVNQIPANMRLNNSKTLLRIEAPLLYHKAMTLFKSADYFNVRIRYKRPNPYVYQKLEWYMDKKETEIEEDQLPLRFYGKELIHVARMARRAKQQFFDPFFVSIRVFIRTPRNLNIPFQPVPRRQKISIGESDAFKSHVVLHPRIKYLLKTQNKTFLREISWVRTLVKNPLFSSNRIENIRSSFLPVGAAIENIFEQKLINKTNTDINSIYSKNTIEYLKSATQDKILAKNQINRNTLTTTELFALDILSEKIVKKQIVSLVSNISQEKQDWNSMIEFLNRPLLSRMNYYADTNVFSTELGAHQVVLYELFLQSKTKNFIESIFKSPFGFLLKKEFNKLLLSNLNNSNIPDDFEYISSRVQNQYNLNKYQKLNTVLLNDLIFIETGFTKSHLRARQTGESSVQDLLNSAFDSSSIKSSKKSFDFNQIYYSQIQANKGTRNLISGKTKTNIFSDSILYPISCFKLDKKTPQHPTLIPPDNIIRTDKPKILARFIQSIKHHLQVNGNNFKVTTPDFEALYESIIKKPRLIGQLNLYRELPLKAETAPKIETLRDLKKVRYPRKRITLRSRFFWTRGKARKDEIALLLKLSALNIKLKNIESKVKNFKLKDYQSYIPSRRLGVFY
jgi:hypothetical protein